MIIFQSFIIDIWPDPIYTSENILLKNQIQFCEIIKRQSCRRIKTSQLICSANQFTDFYMIATLPINELRWTDSLFYNSWINPFHATDLYLYPMKTSENIGA